MIANIVYVVAASFEKHSFLTELFIICNISILVIINKLTDSCICMSHIGEYTE